MKYDSAPAAFAAGASLQLQTERRRIARKYDIMLICFFFYLIIKCTCTVVAAPFKVLAAAVAEGDVVSFKRAVASRAHCVI